MLAPLCHERSYTTKLLVALNGGSVAVVEQGSAERLSGAAHVDGVAGLGFYGEFYNSEFAGAETGAQIASILLRLYEKQGERLADYLDGSFLVYVADQRTKTTLIFNDHYASRPLFYTLAGDSLYFAPELKALALVPGVDTTLDREAMVSFLLGGHVLGAQSYYRAMRPLEPGTVLKIADGAFTRRQYSQYVPNGETPDRGEEHYVDELSALMLAAVKKMSRDAERTMLPLSGGVDSRAIAGCLKQIGCAPIRTVSWGINDTTEGSDAWTGAQVARLLGTEHHFVRRETEHFQRDVGEMIYRIDGLNDDPAFHPNEMSAMRRIRDEFGARAVLRGEECFGPRPEARSDLEALGAAGVWKLEDYPALSALLAPELRAPMIESSRAMADDILAHCPSVDFTDRRDQLYFAVRIFHYHTRSAYYKRTIVDVRNPWLDKDVLAFMQRVPVRYRFDKYLYKLTARRMFPDLFSIPLASTHSLENWTAIIRHDHAMQEYLRFHLVKDRNSFHEMLDTVALERYLEAAFSGETKPPSLMRVFRAVKDALRENLPSIYARLKPALIAKINLAELPCDEVLFRMLMLKQWHDMFVDHRTPR